MNDSVFVKVSTGNEGQKPFISEMGHVSSRGSLNATVSNMWIQLLPYQMSEFIWKLSAQHFFQNCLCIHWAFCSVKHLFLPISFLKVYNLAVKLKILYLGFTKILYLNSYQMTPRPPKLQEYRGYEVDGIRWKLLP